MKYKGSCHCGQIKYEVEGEMDKVMECNCSICAKKGYLLWFVPLENLKLLTPDAKMATYRFNTKNVAHNFCPVCGSAPYGSGKNPKTGAMTAAVNVRCLDDVDIDTLTKFPFDGRSL